MEEASTANLTNRVGRDAALLSLTEIGLGSVLHSLHVPLSGQFLSLNQAFILSRATLAVRALPGARVAGSYISNIAALLKSFAPAGKKLTPMLAISAQGLLFTLGVGVLGANAAGVLVGSVLLSFWAFLQPALIYLIIFGKTWHDLGLYNVEKLQEVLPVSLDNLLIILATMIAIKALLAIAVAALAIWLPSASADRYLKVMIDLSKKHGPKFGDASLPRPTRRAAAKGALRDMLSPLFLISIALTLVFFIYAESDLATILWGIMRPVAAGFVLFYLIRIVNFDTLIDRLDQTRFKGLAQSLAKAIEVLKGI